MKNELAPLTGSVCYNPSRAKWRAGCAIRHQAALLVVYIAALAASGCGNAPESRGKPDQKEMQQIRASVEPDKPPQSLIPTLNLQTVYQPWGVKETAVDALGRIGAGAVPPLIAALHDPNPRIRAEAARALSRMGPAAQDAVQPLTERLHDPEREVRQAAARALGQIGPAAAPAVPALITLLETSDSAPAPGTTPASALPASTRPQ